MVAIRRTALRWYVGTVSKRVQSIKLYIYIFSVVSVGWSWVTYQASHDRRPAKAAPAPQLLLVLQGNDRRCEWCVAGVKRGRQLLPQGETSRLAAREGAVHVTHSESGELTIGLVRGTGKRDVRTHRAIVRVGSLARHCRGRAALRISTYHRMEGCVSDGCHMRTRVVHAHQC